MNLEKKFINSKILFFEEKKKTGENKEEKLFY